MIKELGKEELLGVLDGVETRANVIVRSGGSEATYTIIKKAIHQIRTIIEQHFAEPKQVITHDYQAGIYEGMERQKKKQPKVSREWVKELMRQRLCGHVADTCNGCITLTIKKLSEIGVEVEDDSNS